MELPRKISKFFKSLKRNIVTLHRRLWGKGWKSLGIAIVITIILFAVIMSLTVEATSKPRFCSTCHYMKPYYKSWRESSHKDVTCTDCHFPPGFKSKIEGKFTALSMLVNYFTGVYKKSKPWAEIPNQSCIRGGCHDSRTLSGKVSFKKDIIFDHEPHLKGLRRNKELRCTSCHSQIVQGRHITVTESSCFLCHFKNTDPDDPIHECTKCHEPPLSQGESGSDVLYDHKLVVEKGIECQKCHGRMVIGDGAVPRNRCNPCHSEIEKLKFFSDTEFMHKNHITDHKIECQQCHTEIQHKSVARTEFIKPDCQSCHPDFHNAQLSLFTGKGGKGVPHHPSPMFESGLNCQACHIYHQFSEKFSEKGETFLASAESCEPCHGEGYNKILKRWNEQTQRKLEQLSRGLDMIRELIGEQKNSTASSVARERFEDALFNYNLVKHGNSIHNIAFANQLLEKSYEYAKESLASLKPEAELPYFEHETHILPGECSNCHAGVERTVEKIFGWDFSHYKHLVSQGLSCNECHSNENIHGQLIITKQECMSCHHKEKDPGCQSCHTTQYAIYFSQIAFSSLELPNIMAEDVSCLDCHLDENANLYRPGRDICSDCHEAEYESLFDEWKQTGQALMQKLRDKVKREKLRKGDKRYDTLKLLEKDGSRSIHNPELYEELINEALEQQ